ncbi:MAG: HAD-IA family hydrolase [archaeon]|jgi:HAD superfamily hydrolase (TIGR01509 family)
MKTIIFDVGGVIALHNTPKFAEYLRKKYKISHDFSVDHKQLVIQRDLGKIDEHEFIRKLSRKLKVKINEKEFYKIELEKILQVNKPLIKFIKTKLYKKKELFVFSNNSAVNVKTYSRRIKYEKYFEKCIYSFDLGLRKPDKRFFKNALKLIGKKGKDCIFIDDQLKSKKSAESFGITFVQYKNLSQLKKDLKNLGQI